MQSNPERIAKNNVGEMDSSDNDQYIDKQVNDIMRKNQKKNNDGKSNKSE